MKQQDKINALAAQIAADLFTPGGGVNLPKAKQLRLYSEAGKDGEYLCGWGEGGMATRIAHLLEKSGVVFPSDDSEA